ncbi:hypothetical protein VO54_02672 [Elizabethkingia miricola]|nr:hypothetical protein VO54_02672 [Elizabethkingia miricola]
MHHGLQLYNFIYAIKSKANVIVVNNLKDFSEDYLVILVSFVKSADDFLTDIIDLNLDIVIHVFKEIALD